jgi:hypothetical protein
LKDDVNEMADTLFKFKTDLSGRQPDWKIFEWIQTRTNTTTVHGPRKIGEVIKRKDSPSILFPTRLWASVKAGTPDAVKYGRRGSKKTQVRPTESKIRK